jgi:hypothetical protein
MDSPNVLFNGLPPCLAILTLTSDLLTQIRGPGQAHATSPIATRANTTLMNILRPMQRAPLEQETELPQKSPIHIARALNATAIEFFMRLHFVDSLERHKSLSFLMTTNARASLTHLKLHKLPRRLREHFDSMLR